MNPNIGHCFLIAEIGVNHQGNVDIAKYLIDGAKEAGADAAKFQLFNSQKLWGDDRIKHLELRFEEMTKLYRYCNEVGIEFLCTPFGVEELIFLTPLLKRIKIASGCIKRKPLLAAAKETGLPVILSTGMSTMDEVKEAVETVQSDKMVVSDITILHCTSSYPCRLEDVNLTVMQVIQDELYPYKVGYSDHTSGITVAIAAVALGATVIEKHLTFDRNAEGPDHKCSITPRELKALRIALIEVEAALGDGVKRVMESEKKLKEAWHD